jgi:hypothetical protein
LPHWDNSRILLQYDIYKLTSASPPPRSKKGVQDTADPLQAPTPVVGRSTLSSNVAATPPSSEERRGENEVVQPVNPTANAAANPPANATTNAAGNVANNTANVAGAQQQNIVAHARHNLGAQLAPAQANYPQSSQR